MNKYKGTTIAFRDGILAADSQVTAGTAIVSQSCQKIYKGKGALIGGTGELCKFFAFIRWASKLDWTRLKQPPEYEAPLDGATGIVITRGTDTPYNIINYEDGGWFLDPYSHFSSWGGGDEIALGALHHGASAKEAVEIAVRCSLGTGGPVTTIEFDAPTLDAEIKKATTPRKKRKRKPKLPEMGCAQPYGRNE